MLAAGRAAAGCVLAVLIGQATAPRAATAADAKLIEVRIEVGEPEIVRSGPLDRLLNLDPEILSAERTPDGVALVGRRFGVATLRAWSADGALVLRVQVVDRPRHTPLEGALDGGGPGSERQTFRLTQVTGYNGYWSDTAPERQSIGSEALEMALDLGAFEAGLEAALESRDGAIDSPHHSLLLTRRDAQGAPTGLALGLGHVRVDWNRFTFERERLRGARLDLALPRAGAGPPRLGVELAYGDDAPDYVRLGNRTGPVDPPSARLGGMRAYWRPSSRVATALTFAWREDDEDTSPGGYRGSRVTGLSLDTEGTVGPLDFAGAVAGDGERLAGEADLRLVTASGNLSATARAISKGYASPRTARGQAGARELTLRASRRFGAFTLSAAAAHREDESLSRQELEETEEPCDPLLPPPELGFCPEELRLFARTRSDAWLRAEWTAAPWLRLRGLHQTTDYLLETVRWDQRHSAVGLELRTPRRGSGPARDRRLDGGLGIEWSSVNDRAEAAGGVPESGLYAWQALRVSPRLTLGSLLSADGFAERRFVDPRSVVEPEELLWGAALRLRLARGAVIDGGELRAGYRSWDHLGLLDGRITSGRHLYGGVEIASPWFGGRLVGGSGPGGHRFAGLRLEARAEYSRDVEIDVGTLAVEVGLRVGLGGGEGRAGRGRVRGRVFLDRDGDGRPDPGEAGVPGVAVRLADGREAVTDDDGAYELRRVPGPSATVRLVAETAPAHLRPTSPVVVEAAPGEPAATSLDFGLGQPPAVLELLAFNDVDGDGLRSGDEPPLGGAVVTLDDLGVAVGSEPADEPVRREIPLPAERQAAWRVTALPEGYRAPRGTEPVMLRPGRTTRLELPLRAQRTIRGTVFLDADGDGRRSPGEQTVENAVVLAGRRVARSDSKGRYRLLALPAGALEVEIRPESVPPGWGLARPLGVELDDGPVEVELPLPLRLLPGRN